MLKKLALSAAAVAAFATSSEAALLGVVLQPYPDVFSSFISVNYNAGTQQFTASGFALSFNDDGVAPNINITGGSFNLTATVDNSGVATSGSLTIGGTIPSYSAPLLTGSLSQMGWSSTVGLFDFLFTVTGGSLANDYYGGIGAVFGVILNANSSNYAGNWGVNFNNTGSGVSDTATVPTPGALAVLVAAVCQYRQRRRTS